jgi:hypothetical protein
MGFDPTIAVLERAKTVRALDRSATAIGIVKNVPNIIEHYTVKAYGGLEKSSIITDLGT